MIHNFHSLLNKNLKSLNYIIYNLKIVMMLKLYNNLMMSLIILIKILLYLMGLGKLDKNIVNKQKNYI
jgi:hypothetical protein